MKSKFRLLAMFVVTLVCGAAQADSNSLLMQAQSANPTRYQFAIANNAELRATSDNKAFSIWWQPGTGVPAGVIVGLHGHGSYATDDFAMWQPFALARGYAVLALQWWFGGGEAGICLAIRSAAQSMSAPRLEMLQRCRRYGNGCPPAANGRSIRRH
jgi:hypothetical protein